MTALTLVLAPATVLAPGPAAAQATLLEALVRSYQTSPILASALADLRATNEQIAQALSGFRPTVVARGSVGQNWTRSVTDVQGADGGTSASIGAGFATPSSVGVEVSQPIYQGGSTFADVDRAELVIQATRAGVVTTEQEVLLTAATAFLNVVEAQAVLELAINNEDVLRRQLEAAQDRFEVGEITRTDVSQAESRLAGATAGRIEAEGALRSTRATFERAVGNAAPALIPPQPLVGLPTSLDEAVSLAQVNNPQVIQATFTERAAVANVDVLFGDLLPEVSVVGGITQSFEPQRTTDNSTAAEIRAELTVPIYQAGAVSSRVREARYDAARARIDIEDARRASIETAIVAWESLVTAQAAIESLQAQVRAAEIALEGVEQEAQVGSRTVLDVLDAEQELLDARVELVRAQRDEVVAGFEILSSVGQLTARDLSLPVEYYEFDGDYNATRSRLIGTDVD